MNMHHINSYYIISYQWNFIKFGCCSLIALSGPCPEMSPPGYHHWPSELQELGLQASVTNRDQGKRCFFFQPDEF